MDEGLHSPHCRMFGEKNLRDREKNNCVLFNVFSPQIALRDNDRRCNTYTASNDTSDIATCVGFATENLLT